MTNDATLQALCWFGIFLAAIAGGFPIIKGLISRRRNPSQPEDHLEERNQAAAMLIAGKPYARRVQAIYNLLERITVLEQNTPKPDRTPTNPG